MVGTRPNIIKITQFSRFNDDHLEFKIVHTGQHYDEKMADSFFKQLRTTPDFYLNIKPASANTQISEVMIGLERVCKEYLPDLLMAVGDVNSTLAAALSANKLGIRLAHLESGLRSRDRSMPEEINRIITDELSDLFFITEQSGFDNLKAEGKPEEHLFQVGNTMIDALVAFEDEIMKSAVTEDLKLQKGNFLLMTMHRPSNVDSREGLKRIIDIITHFQRDHKIVFPIHPRTHSRLKEFGLLSQIEGMKGVILTEPKDYFSFQKLIAWCRFVITDSGGIQEETTFRGVPCFTLRPSTERPSTIIHGTNVLIPSVDLDGIIQSIKESSGKRGGIPPGWDGKSTDRIVDILRKVL